MKKIDLTHINGRIVYRHFTFWSIQQNNCQVTLTKSRGVQDCTHPFRDQSNCTRAWIDSCGKFRIDWQHWSIETSAELIVASLIARKAFNHGGWRLIQVFGLGQYESIKSPPRNRRIEWIINKTRSFFLRGRLRKGDKGNRHFLHETILRN